MKKLRSRKSSATTKAALFTSAATLVLAGTSYAQSSDALIDKLVDKGILTTKEAQDLRDESDNDFKTAFQAKTGMPDWVNSYSLNGSVRGRFEQYSGDNAAAIDRTRLRYRILVGLKVNMLDDLEAGFRLGSGDAKTGGAASSSVVGNPLSQNSTMQDNFSDKGVYVDLAYGKWSPIHSGAGQLAFTVGKMENPFQFTPMVFDQDLTPEGAAMQSSYNINDQHSITFTGAAFVLDEEQFSTHDPFMYGGQVMWNAKWTPKWSSTLGVGAFEILGTDQLNAGTMTLLNYGNTRIGPAASPTSWPNSLAYQYNPIIADASVTYTLDTFPLYTGAFPIKWQAEFMNNPGAPSTQDKGYWVGVKFGKSGTKGTWDISYRYEYLESDAWYDQMVDDDNIAYYSGNISGYSGTQAGSYTGGTNIKGHMINFNYSLTDSLTFSATCFINSLITTSQLTPYTTAPAPGTSGSIANLKNTDAIHFFADLMWKF